MSWSDSRFRSLSRLAAALIVAGLTAGCFQPLYGTATTGGTSVGPALKSVDVSPITVPNGTRLSRVSVVLRDALIFNLTGGTGQLPATHRLVTRLSSSNLQVIVDIDTARPDIQNYGLTVSYQLIDNATGRVAISGETFARVSYDTPGQQQRFVGERGLRDAEDRAARVVAEQLRARLASFFAAGA